MDTLEAIAQRRSIRRFKDTPVPDEIIEQILRAGTQAPSGKNRQPWRFYVVRGDKVSEMVDIIVEGISEVESRGWDTGSSKWTVRVMERAPVTVFVFNPFVEYRQAVDTAKDVIENSVDVQSAGAAIQNMLLAAQALGIGSLWICDVFYAYEELCAWLNETHQMIAAVSFGYADEQPNARPRKPVSEVTQWL
jgi:nitroreductase